MQIGAQLYTLRTYAQTESDFARSMERVAKMGYKVVQVSGVGDIKPERIRTICDEAGLKIVLTHFSTEDELMYNIDKVIEDHNIMGCDFIGIGGMPGKYRTDEWLWNFPVDFKNAAQKIAEAGKLLMYHNHAFEFRRVTPEGAPDVVPGKKFIEYLADWFTPAEMGFTLDTYWVQAAGGDVCDWIRRLSGRVPCAHLKDMGVNKDNETIMTPVFEGNMNFTDILSEFEKAGCKYALVEQDWVYDASPFDCLKKSYDNLAKAGYR